MRGTYAHALKEVLGLVVDIKLAGLGLGDVESGDLRDVLVLALTLLLLELEGDTADRATLDTLHEVGGVTSDLYTRLALALLQPNRIRNNCRISTNLVAKTLGGNDSDLIADTLVGLEVESESGVVTLDDDLGGSLDGLVFAREIMISF